MLQGTCGKISQISVQSSRDAELVNRRQLETILMKSYFGTTDWEQYQPKITWVLLLSPVTVFFQHKLTISLDSKICTQRCNKRVISSKSLFIICLLTMISSIITGFYQTIHTQKVGNCLITLSLARNTSACVNFWTGVLTFTSFLGDNAVKNLSYSSNRWVVPKVFSLDVQFHRQTDMAGVSN